MRNFNILQRITLTALLLSLDIIATRFLGIYVTPYVRLSVGVSVTIFSSILLGPISGMIIAGGADILGILLFNFSGVSINPFITISYAIMGLIPGLIYKFKSKIKISEKMCFFILNIFLLLIFTIILVFSLITNQIVIFNNTIIFNTLIRVLIISISFILIILIDLFSILFNKHFKKKIEIDDSIPSTYLILFIVLFIEIIFTLIINTLIKSLFYGVSFEIIFFPALLLAFIYIPFNTIIVSYLCLLSSKIIKNFHE